MTARGWLSTWSGLSSHAKLADTMPQVKVPTMLVHPTADTEIRVWQAKEIVDAAGAERRHLPGDEGRARTTWKGHRQEALAAVAEWLAPSASPELRRLHSASDAAVRCEVPLTWPDVRHIWHRSSSRAGSRDQFVDLDVPAWAWLALAATIALMLGIDLFRHRVPHEPTPKEALTESLIWVTFGLVVRRRHRAGLRWPGHHRVPLGLRDREVAQHRQRVRVGDVVRQLQDSAEVPAPGAVLGHLRRAAPARPLHLGRYGAHLQVLVGAAGLRCAAHLHRPQDPASTATTRARRSTPPASSCSRRSCRSPTSSTARSSSPW